LSLATGVFIYFALFPLYGFWIVAGIISYLIGQLIFYWVATRKSIDLDSFWTVGNFVRTQTGSVTLSIIVESVSLLSFLAVLLVEMIVGVDIFAALFPAQDVARLVALFGLSIVVCAYVALGGFRAIMASDSWQFRLIATASLALFVATISLYVANPTELSISGSSTSSDIRVYVVFAILLNLNLSIGRLASWQRLAATQKKDRLRGFLLGVMKSGALWFAFLLVAFFIHNTGIVVSTWSDLFVPIKQLGGAYAEFLFPIIFVGLVATLLSTADSAAIAVLHSVFSGVVAQPFLKRLNWKTRRRFYLGILVGLFALVCLFYFFYRRFTPQTTNTFMNIVFYLFGQLIVVSPLVVSLAIGRNQFRYKRVLIAGIILSWLILIAGTLMGISADRPTTTFIANMIGYSVAFLSVIIGLKRATNVQQPAPESRLS